MREPYKILFLLTLTLVLYLPSLRSGYCVMDDVKLVEHMTAVAKEPLSKLLDQKSGEYFRPLMTFSYLVDATLWEMKASLSHLANILVHFFNALLIYFIVRFLSLTGRDKTGHLPLIAAVLFVAHPINTESINWISGRTDPLASMFCLLAFYLFIRGWRQERLAWLFLSALCVLLGSLAKEVAFTMNAGFMTALLFLKNREPLIHQGHPLRLWRLSACTPYLLGIGGYLYLRSSGFSRLDSGLGKIASATTEDLLWPRLEIIVSAFGFYLKKLVAPVPLNFAIDGVHPGYFWIGIIALLLAFLLLLQRNLPAVCLLFILLAIFPAALNATLKFAWTPYAERYLYLPSAIFAIGLAISSSPGRYHKLQQGMIVLLVIMLLPVSIQRNLLWADQLEFLKRTHAQAPQNPVVWNMYGIQLAEDEYFPAARDELKKIIAAFPEQQNAYRNLAKMELFIHDQETARQVLQPFYAGQMKPGDETLQVMINVNRERLENQEHVAMMTQIRAELIRDYRLLYDSGKDLDKLLEIAKYSLENGDQKTAEDALNELLTSNKRTDEQQKLAQGMLQTL